MGHGSSRSDTGNAEAEPPAHPPRFSRLRRLLHPRDPAPPGAVVDFAGILRIEIVHAEMKSKEKWFACLTLGERTYRTDKSEHTEKPVWKSEKHIVLESGGPHIARIAVFETSTFSGSKLAGYSEVDLFEILKKDGEKNRVELALRDPSSSFTDVGCIYVSYYLEDPTETEKRFARRVLAIVDYNEDGKLSYAEFSDLINAFGNHFAVQKVEELFKHADKNDDGTVDMDELAVLLATQNDKETLISNCPVCGETLGKDDKMSDIIHMTLCFDEGTGNQIMTGGFLTEKQASYGWMFKLTEWVHFSSYDIGLHSGSSASHILVYDRRTQILVEEAIDPKIVMSLRALYQSKVGLALMDAGVKDLLQNMSEKQGKKMNSRESVKDIPKFIEFFKDQINMDEAKLPAEKYETFNDFFVRELKPGARPISCVDQSNVAVCAADCRLTVFASASEGQRLWIKGRKFSIQGLLGTEQCTNSFSNGSLAIFRLAPQDYHRFHVPVSGTIENFVEIPGSLYTVNPIAVNSKYCNVFTENKRVVSIISTEKFGKVAFVAIGATMVGSITFSRSAGEYVHKGDEFGYFSFGGSTVVCVFEENTIQFDDDLIANSERSLETLVQVGMHLGVSKRA